jgi:opacity protein-like surface antigen
MKIRFRSILASALVTLGAVAPLRAQSGGDGFMFHAPQGRLTIRAGYDHANANSDIFNDAVNFFTLNRADFSGMTIGGEAAYSIGSRFDISADLSFSHKSKGSEYRALVDNNNQPIEQNTTFDRIPLTVNARFYLVEPGRSIGNFAWIPNKIVPWVGGGAGVMWYRFNQTGDFVDYQTNNVFTATDGEFSASESAATYHAMAGADFNLSPHVALRLDSRYVWANASLPYQFKGYNNIDLSGVQGTLGLTYRL